MAPRVLHSPQRAAHTVPTECLRLYDTSYGTLFAPLLDAERGNTARHHTLFAYSKQPPCSTRKPLGACTEHGYRKVLSMLGLILPRGHTFGWGVCGKYLTRELARLSPVALLTEPFAVDDIGDELDYLFLQGVSAALGDCIARTPTELPYPVLQAITDHRLMPMAAGVRGTRTIGYTFFEHSLLSARHVEQAQRFFDVIVAGSSWCRDVLSQHGVDNTCTILQGIDETIFHPYANQKRYFEDHFVIFSGGKFELRKGQDLVIRAFQIFHERHKDVLLVNSWFNQWSFSMQTMAGSPYINYQLESEDYCTAMNKLLAANGIDLSRVITLPPKANIAMARIYKNSDCGLFPNRCEGGSNLVLMEYMACGKPAIVANTSGHRDVANATNALLLRDLRPLSVAQDEAIVAVWDEPNLDEILAQLEWAYDHRDALNTLGAAAGRSMEHFTWQATARQFYDLIENVSSLGQQL
jgi:glycosyltransferase involved in cell wall biosynthesis